MRALTPLTMTDGRARRDVSGQDFPVSLPFGIEWLVGRLHAVTHMCCTFDVVPHLYTVCLVRVADQFVFCPTRRLLHLKLRYEVYSQSLSASQFCHREVCHLGLRRCATTNVLSTADVRDSRVRTSSEII